MRQNFIRWCMHVPMTFTRLIFGLDQSLLKLLTSFESWGFNNDQQRGQKNGGARMTNKVSYIILKSNKYQKFFSIIIITSSCHVSE